MTDRVRIGNAINSRIPYFTAKAADGFLILGDLLEKEQVEDPHNMELELKINGDVKQQDNTGNMFFKINDQMNFIEETGTTLCEGDLLLSGTPEGQAAVKPGDLIEATLKTPDGNVISEIIKDVIKEKRA